MNILPQKYQISSIFSSASSFYYKVPKYQREYTWSYSEWEALYDDLTENDEGYFIGSIIYINQNGAMNPILEVVDGQQRLTTLSLLLAAIYCKLKHYKDVLSEDQFGDFITLKKSLVNSQSPNGLMIVPQAQNFNFDDYSAVMSDNGIISFSTRQPYYKCRKINRCFH